MKNIAPKDFYNYFHDCYKLDHREFAVDNLLSSKYKYKWFEPKQEELFNDSLPCIPYNNSKVDELRKEIEVYKLEKKLFYGCFFVLGKSENGIIKDKRICAPLLLFPASIKQIDDLTYLEIDIQASFINGAALSKLDLKNDSLTKDSFIREVWDNIPNKHGDALWIRLLLDKYFTNQNSDELILYPKTWSVNKIRSCFSKDEIESGNYKIVPAAGTFLASKSQSSLRVLNDLETMAEQNSFNTSLKELVGNSIEKSNFGSSYFKSRLNKEQYQALQSTSIYSNTILIGPPGTGKSFTISSVVADAVAKGESVLVVSKTKQAVEVIRKMLETDFKLREYIIHTSGAKYKLSLKTKVKKYLSGILARQNHELNEIKIERIHDLIKKLESQFNILIEKELRLSELEFSQDLGLLDKLRKFILKKGILSSEKIWDLFSRINSLSTKLDKELKTYAKKKIAYNIQQNTNKFRQDLSLYYDSIDSESFTEYKKRIRQIKYKNILQIFPLWLANLSDLNSVLPLEKELFDLVIIDEATQCDIASALPAIFRAKKVLIAGDPNQLKHYSFVSSSQQQYAQKKYNLPDDKIFDYRNRSILDLFISKVQEQKQLIFLREHYRSTPSLIEFSNRQFYDGQLEVIKSTPKHTSSSQIKLIQLDGHRNEQGINKEEAQAVMNKLDELIKEYTHLKVGPSIGVISPFTSQVSYINSLLREKYNLNTLKKFNITCGTPYNFQGSEREIILLSFAVCDNSHHSAFIHATKAEVMNVAITRAKSFQYVFSSTNIYNQKKSSLLSQYLAFIEQFNHFEETLVTTDVFQQEVAESLKSNGYPDVKFAYPVAGSLLDLLIVHNESNYFIDLIGYPGMFNEAYSMERYKTLGHTGINCFPLHYSYWKANKEKAINKILEFIGDKN